MRIITTFLLILYMSPLCAEIILDGSLGQSGHLFAEFTDSQTVFNIEEHFGKRLGNNLFHSFEAFNLVESNEVALFSGNNNIHNIITRVTGGQSFINGTIRSSIPNVHFYLLNPKGVFFSEFANLDIQGSFYISTADTIYLGDKTTQFNATYPQDSILSSAPPSAFGFLTSEPAHLELQGKGLLLKADHTRLSLVGGNIRVGTEGTDKASTKLLATEQVNILSVASQGEILIDDKRLTASSGMQGGNIYIDNLKNRNVLQLGDMSIWGGDIQILNTDIYSFAQTGLKNLFSIKGDNVTLDNVHILSSANHIGEMLDISIQAHNINLLNNSSFITTPELLGTQGGDIKLEATQKINLSGASELNSRASAISRGNGGDIFIKAAQFTMNDASILNFSSSLNRGGIVYIDANDIRIEKGNISVATTSFGQAGNQLSLIGHDIYLGEKAYIQADSVFTGLGGVILIQAVDKLIINGGLISGRAFEKVSQYGNTGNTGNTIGGNIDIQASEISMMNYATIDSSTASNGNAGSIDMSANKITLAEHAQIASTSDFAQGHAGDINIKTSELYIKGEESNFTVTTGRLLYTTLLRIIDNEPPDPREPTGIFADSLNHQGNTMNAGNAGNIHIKSDKVILETNSYISTFAEKSSGGNIDIDANSLVLLRGSEVSTDVNGETTSGGNVAITNPEFVVMDNSQIVTRAQQGFGGDIRINTDQFLVSNQYLTINSNNGQNILNAASNIVERSGTVAVPQVAEDITKQLLSLPTDLGKRLLSRNCLIRDVQSEGSFKIGNLAGYAIPLNQLHRLTQNNTFESCTSVGKPSSILNLY